MKANKKVKSDTKELQNGSPVAMIRPVIISHRGAESHSSRSQLSDSLHKTAQRLLKIPITPLNCSFGLVAPNEPVPLGTVLKDQARIQRSNVTALFWIRNAGCGSCKEHALQLSKELVQLDRKIALIGMVQDMDDPDLLEFYHDYFHCPIYLDSKRAIESATGGTPAKAEPVKLGQRFFSKDNKCKIDPMSRQMYSSSSCSQSGLLIFDKKGRLRFYYEEKFGEEFNLQAILKAAQIARDGRLSGDDDTTISSSVADNTESFLSHLDLPQDIAVAPR